jgi:D-alanyl-D-alanine endopeptidase (penicillin-binding protein 7)
MNDVRNDRHAEIFPATPARRGRRPVGGAVLAAAALAVALGLPAGAQAKVRHHRHAVRHAVATVDGPLALRSRAALVVDTTAGTVLYQRAEDSVRPIASITKLMTALVVLEAGQPLDEELTIGEEEADATRRSVSRLTVGTRLTRAELLNLALMASENRAAYALARHYPGGLAACMKAMHAKASALGMTQTRFVEPTGLSSDNVSTSADLTKLVRAAAAQPLIKEYSTAPSLVVRVRGRPTEFRNTDRLVHDPTWDLVVQKTGYIEEAGRCLVLQTVVAGREFVIVLLDSVGQATRFADARRIRRWLEHQAATHAVPVHAVTTAPAHGLTATHGVVAGSLN